MDVFAEPMAIRHDFVALGATKSCGMARPFGEAEVLGVKRRLALLIVAICTISLAFLTGSISAAGLAPGLSVTYRVSASIRDVLGSRTFDQVVTNSVTGVNAASVEVSSTETNSGQTRTLSYAVPANVVYRPLRGLMDPLGADVIRSVTETVTDQSSRTRETTLVARGFVQRVDLVGTFGSASALMTIELLGSSGNAAAPAGSALFLLPSQFGPSDGVTITSNSGAPSTAAGGTVALVSPTLAIGPATTALADGTYYTDSDLVTYDNSLLYIPVWETELRVDGDVGGGAFTAFRANMTATPRSPNWICDYLAGAWDAAFYPTPSPAGAKAWGEGRFYGFFPLPLFASLWRGVGHHEHELTLSGWNLWETATIDAFGPDLGSFRVDPHWYNWKTVVLHSGTPEAYGTAVVYDSVLILPR